MRAAVIENGVVVNVIVVDDLTFADNLPDEQELVESDTASIGDKYENGEFVA